MLAYFDQENYRLWFGESVNGIHYPLNIEQLWSDAELLSVGFYRIIPFTTPVGYERTGQPRYELNVNVVNEIYDIILTFDPTNWYWIIGSDTTQVYSSQTGTFVLVNDSTYQAWLTSGGIPTTIATIIDLGIQLSRLGLRPTDATVLDAWKDAQVTNILDVIFKVLYDHENRIRVLEGKSTITPAQARAGIKALL